MKVAQLLNSVKEKNISLTAFLWEKVTKQFFTKNRLKNKQKYGTIIMLKLGGDKNGKETKRAKTT